MTILPYGLSSRSIRLVAALFTLAELRLFYSWRWLTFFIWTNAALIDHSYPRVTVTALEVIIAAVCYAITYRLVDVIDFCIWNKRREPR